ncbi:MAG: immunoglobulin domain-containing protein [Patescibacteria group bacterium]|nr:immunoglobulin domain-containing protein [Patescibacteria group bacterium]
MKKIYFYIILAGAVAAGGMVAARPYLFTHKAVDQNKLVDDQSGQSPDNQANQNSDEQVIGGQKDERGCLIAAGYSWCEAKQKCLRTWEEACTTDDALKNYLRDNLSALSPEKEVLGGKFYVADLKVISSTKAEVTYEDGHNQFRAQFNYSLQDGKVKITNFNLITDTPPAVSNPAPAATTSPAQQGTVQLTFQPMQCEDEPWQKWYSEGGIKFIKEPTDEELIMAYYGQAHSLQINSASRADSGNATCNACYACPKSYSFTATVPASDAAALEALGWKQ